MISRISQFSTRLALWLVNDERSHLGSSDRPANGIDWMRALPFIAIHLGCALVLVVGVSPIAVATAIASYVLRMFFITAFYHRYFSHRAYQASRPVQFCMAVLGCTAGQRGPIWWAAHHREHHLTSDTVDDVHSPVRQGFIYSHCLWFLTNGSFSAPTSRVKDWLRLAELRWLERLDWVPFVALGFFCWLLGVWLQKAHPTLGTNGPQMLVWGFFVSTVVLYHATYTINSLAHRFGSRRFDTDDNSRNNPWLALITLGEGWHNNHHHYPASARQGFYWWELDLAYAGLCALRALGLIRDLRPVPDKVLATGLTGGPRS